MIFSICKWNNWQEKADLWSVLSSLISSAFTLGEKSFIHSEFFHITCFSQSDIFRSLKLVHLFRQDNIIVTDWGTLIAPGFLTTLQMLENREKGNF